MFFGCVVLGRLGIILVKFQDMSQCFGSRVNWVVGASSCCTSSIIVKSQRNHMLVFIFGLVAFPGVKAYFCWYKMLPIQTFITLSHDISHPRVFIPLVAIFINVTLDVV